MTEPVVRGCTCFLVRKLARRLTQFYDHEMAPTGLTLTQYSVLCHLMGAAPKSMRQLAAEMGADRTTLTRLLKPLHEAGWVAEMTGTDRRHRLLTLTPEGRAKREAAKPVWKAAQLRVNAEVGVEPLAELHALIDKVVDRAPAAPDQ